MKSKPFALLILVVLLFAGAVLANEDPYTIALEKIAHAAETRTTVLHLDMLALTELPPEIGQLTWLRELDISDNLLQDLPPELGNLQELRMLELSHNNFEYLPLVVTELSNLEILNIGFNNLLAIPSEIGTMPRLRQLFAHSNALTYLPSEIGDLSQLERLYLNHNYLTALPVEIGQLSRLQMLVVDDNQLEDIPPVLDNLPYLRVSVVSLADNQQEQTSSFGRMSALNLISPDNPNPLQNLAGINIALLALLIGIGLLTCLLAALLLYKPIKRKRKPQHF